LEQAAAQPRNHHQVGLVACALDGWNQREEPTVYCSYVLEGVEKVASRKIQSLLAIFLVLSSDGGGRDEFLW
jgi:hypothetical protein